MSVIKKHINLLGYEAKDKVTGYSGVITSVCFDLYGCIQAALTPKATNDKSEYNVGSWFDITRLEISKDKKVMETPKYEKGYIAEGRKGASIKPVMR